MRKHEDSTEEKVVNGPGKWIVASLVGIGTGTAKFITDVRNEFFLNVKQYPEFDEQLRDHGKKIGGLKNARLGEKRIYNKLTGVLEKIESVEKTINTEQFISGYAKEKNRFFQQANEFAERLGIKSGGISGYSEGSIQRFRMLSETTKTPIVFESAATTVIGFAGTLMLANSLVSRNHLKHIEDALKHKEKEQENSRS